MYQLLIVFIIFISTLFATETELKKHPSLLNVIFAMKISLKQIYPFHNIKPHIRGVFCLWEPNIQFTSIFRLACSDASSSSAPLFVISPGHPEFFVCGGGRFGYQIRIIKMKKIANYDEVLKNNLNQYLVRILNGTQNFLESPFQNKISKKGKKRKVSK